jgi:hypothetical protein
LSGTSNQDSFKASPASRNTVDRKPYFGTLLDDRTYGLDRAVVSQKEHNKGWWSCRESKVALSALIFVKNFALSIHSYLFQIRLMKGAERDPDTRALLEPLMDHRELHKVYHT